jgi:starch phosphorylase
MEAGEPEDGFGRLPKSLEGLGELAANLWWSWHPAARMLFKTLDRAAWKESGHNPAKMLREIPEERLVAAAGDEEFLQRCGELLSQSRRDLSAGEACFTAPTEQAGPCGIAYFSAEFGLHHSLPFYAGGLGFLAGDYIKECSDLRVPLVAVGFMYPEGYVRQRMREDGWQDSMDERVDRDAASISRVIGSDGAWLQIRVPLMEPPIHVGVWKVAVGRTPLYLLDTDIDSNDPWNREISARLYVGDIEHRLRQEIVLGIGGCEVLRTMGISYEVLHLNEGHAAFALLERVRERVDRGLPYEQAAEQVRATSVFTTHTPVPAGHDVFPFELMERYFGSYRPALRLDHDAFLKLGIHPEAPAAGFNMTAFALRMSGYRNGVSRRHGEVARRMWHCLWPDLPEEKVPIDHVTNGVHVPTWIEPKVELLLNRVLGPDWLEHHDSPTAWERIDTIPDEELWQVHYWLKMKLINTIREYARRRWVEDRVSPSIAIAGGTLLDPSVLTIGFARRFATYKRAGLIFTDLNRLKRLVHDRWRPVQFVFAGKAHPADDPGKLILQRVFNAARDPALGGRIAFVEDYDEQLAQYMVHGVDVWLNSPRPPMEACGTSGMKAALNGVPHLSIIDGWWVEAFNGGNGWAFGGEANGDNDASDAEALYRVLEQDVVPLYYQTSGDGVPRGWIKLMKESMKSNGPRFSARRMVKEYAEKFYAPALRRASPPGSDSQQRAPA